jgi:hypothetical protein
MGMVKVKMLVSDSHLLSYVIFRSRSHGTGLPSNRTATVVVDLTESDDGKL